MNLLNTSQEVEQHVLEQYEHLIRADTKYRMDRVVGYWLDTVS